MLDEILLQQGRPQTTNAQFNKFFAQFDKDGDGNISQAECYNFVDQFLNSLKREPTNPFYDPPRTAPRRISPHRRSQY